MNAKHWILLACWAMFSVLHSGMAAEKCKRFCQPVMGAAFKYYRLAYSMIALVSLGIVLLYQFSMPSPVLRIGPPVKCLVAFPMGILGVILMAVSVRKYFFSLSGIGVLFPKNGAAILWSDGLNKYTRHPLYLGTLLLIWSLFLFFPLLSNLLDAVAITVYTLLGIRWEERKLLLDFGNEYASYRRKTAMLIPHFLKTGPSSQKVAPKEK
jgi:methanethiol S-methyltransferase